MMMAKERWDFRICDMNVTDQTTGRRIVLFGKEKKVEATKGNQITTLWP